MRAVGARDLVFRYGRRAGAPALEGCSFEVRRGEVYGVLGPNGAGKTTLLRLLGTLLVPTSGSLELLGCPMPGGERRVRARLGVATG
jgi:ABC-type multidrug transport system ATPase subunit